MKFKLLLLCVLLFNGASFKTLQAFNFDAVEQQFDVVAFQDEDDSCLDDVAASVKEIKTVKQEVTFKDKVYFGFLALWMFGILKPYQYCKAKIAVLVARMQRSA